MIDVIEDSKLATKELLKSKGNTIVYHTGSYKIVIEMRTPTGLRVEMGAILEEGVLLYRPIFFYKI